MAQKKQRDVFAEISTDTLPEDIKKHIRDSYQAGHFEKVSPAGSSAIPAMLVGREQQMARLIKLVNEVCDESAYPSPSIIGVVLHGPKGTGKTTLLNALQQGLKRTGKANVVSMTGDNALLSSKLLIGRLSKHMALPSETTETYRGDVKADANALVFKGETSGGVEVAHKTTEGHQPVEIQSCLESVMDSSPNTPLMILVDEAHGASPDVLGRLLNAIQALTREPERSVGIVLAGTPDTLDVLSDQACKATWFRDLAQEERSAPMPNDLTIEDCRKAMTTTLNALDVTIDDEHNLTDMLAKCKGIPYFLQPLGKAALQAARNHNDTADFQAGGEIDQRFGQAAINRHASAWRDLEHKGLTGCALQLGAIWKAQSEHADQFRIDTQIIRKAMQSGLDHGPGRDDGSIQTTSQANTHFGHLGLLWSPSLSPDGPWDLGLPSFFDYVEMQFSKTHYEKERTSLHADMKHLLSELRES